MIHEPPHEARAGAVLPLPASSAIAVAICEADPVYVGVFLKLVADPEVLLTAANGGNGGLLSLAVLDRLVEAQNFLARLVTVVVHAEPAVTAAFAARMILDALVAVRSLASDLVTMQYPALHTSAATSARRFVENA